MSRLQMIAGESVVVVTRHPATSAFIAEELGGTVSPDGRTITVPGLAPISVFAEVNPELVRGKLVIGNLPMQLACQANRVCAVEFSGTPPRGQEYGVAEMRSAGAQLTPYKVTSLLGVALTPEAAATQQALSADALRTREANLIS